MSHGLVSVEAEVVTVIREDDWTGTGVASMSNDGMSSGIELLGCDWDGLADVSPN